MKRLKCKLSSMLIFNLLLKLEYALKYAKGDVKNIKAIMSCISEKMLAYYDTHARELPWRISWKMHQSGIRPNPYFIWLSEIMLQQTTVATVKEYYLKFITKWPTLFDLAAAPIDDIMQAWAGLGYYSRARNLHKTACIIVEQYDGNFPQSPEILITLPGIGPYSAASISAIAFDKSAAVMDGNIERIISRLYCVEEMLPQAKKILYCYVQDLTPPERAGDYAQSMMDLGATICTPKKPLCVFCPLKQNCQAFKTGTQEAYPKKRPKVKKPTYDGKIFLITDLENAHILLQKRPDKGLFGGMEIFPYYNPHEHKNIKIFDMRSFLYDYIKPPQGDGDLYQYNKQCNKLGKIKHIFTHFTLMADIIHIQLDQLRLYKNDVRCVPINQLNHVALPTLMTKALKLFEKENTRLISI